MSITLDLPPAALLRLEAEAARRGVSLDVVIAEFAESLPAPAEPDGPAGTRFAFAGVAASGDGKLSERSSVAASVRPPKPLSSQDFVATTRPSINHRDFRAVRRGTKTPS